MTTVQVGQPSAALLLEAVSPTDNLLARLDVGALKAEKMNYLQHPSAFQDLADYFSSLERDWRGWTGVRTWTSIENDLQLRAEHHGHIQICVELKSYQDPSWSAAADLSIEPGEQLSLIATQSRQLARPAVTNVPGYNSGGPRLRWAS